MAPLAVVVPTCRPASLATFLEAWTPLFKAHDVKLIVVKDEQETWDQLPDFIPHHTGSIRSWGFLQAYREGYDVLTLDDDVLPADENAIGSYLSHAPRRFAVSDYFDVGHTFGLGEYMRGYPFHHRRVARPALQYGGWDNVPDMDAITQRQYEEQSSIENFRFGRRALAIPKGCAFTGCIMNVWIRHDLIPVMYQLIMGIDRVGYDRWDDIWSGLFAKRICDHLGMPIIVNGHAATVHTRASDTDSNYAKEVLGYDLNDVLWDRLGIVKFTKSTPIECYQELTDQLRPEWFGPQGQKIIDGMNAWTAAIR